MLVDRFCRRCLADKDLSNGKLCSVVLGEVFVREGAEYLAFFFDLCYY